MVVFIVAYDISDDERRLRMMRALLTLGYSRLQRSVYIYRRGFEAIRKATIERAARIIDPTSDSLLIIPVPDNMVSSIIKLGLHRWDDEVVAI
ncbi:MAG: CRISPR-associated endonuclease Cas2 [Desulfurococcales archaeon]|nr:CRISPR-associated endonuclease Cas2 [Desulfurococcales archaeon]